MPEEQRPVIVGTAGHIDHGKTTLTKALTGQDTDRLPEEKHRGISIDLGFADMTLPNKRHVALIDVPGHERFIRNMVAGVHGMDAVMLVVAADEGIMPQTREHLDILLLLGVEYGVTVITKADTVDAEFLELATEVIRDELRDTFLARNPVFVVDAISGRGIDSLKKGLVELTDQLPSPSVTFGASARLPIDRVFSVKGFGTVVTGTLTGGSFHNEQTLELIPSGSKVRVRGLQVHGHKVNRATSGQRVAVNLAGIEKDEVFRGHVLALPGQLKAEETLVVEVTLLPTAHPLVMNAPVHCHLATAETIGRVYLYDRDVLNPGETSFAEVRLETPITAVRGDRCLLRSYSPVMTIGGGIVLEAGRRHRRKERQLMAHLEGIAKGSDDDIVRNVVWNQDAPITTEQISRDSGVEVMAVQAILAKTEGLLFDGDHMWWASHQRDNLMESLAQHVRNFHRQHPLREGIGREVLRTELGLSRWTPKIFSWALSQMDQLIAERDGVRDASFSVTPTPKDQQRIHAVEEAIFHGGLKPATLEAIQSALGFKAEDFYDIIDYLQRYHRIVRLDDTLYISREVFQKAEDAIRQALSEGKSLSTGELKDVLSTSRRYAVMILESFDAMHITRRIGDKRVLVS